MCLKCWNGVGGVARALDEASEELKALTCEVAGEAASLVERSRRFIHELRGRVTDVRSSMRKMESAIREANAEVRREKKKVRELWPKIEEAEGEMPDD